MRNVKGQKAEDSRQKAAERVQGGTAALGSKGAPHRPEGRWQEAEGSKENIANFECNGGPGRFFGVKVNSSSRCRSM